MKLFPISAILAASAFLAACATSPPALPGPSSGPPDREDAIMAVAATAATIADATGVAPPATITAKVTIDDRAIDTAIDTFETTLTIIEAFVDTGVVTPGSPKALAIRNAVLAVKDGLVAASFAQDAGNARTYRAALGDTQQALAALRSALAR